MALDVDLLLETRLAADSVKRLALAGGLAATLFLTTTNDADSRWSASAGAEYVAADDPNLAGDLLQEFDLWLDRRREFPRKVAELGVPRERPVPASMLAPVRRILADSVAQERPVDRTAIAGD